MLKRGIVAAVLATMSSLAAADCEKESWSPYYAAGESLEYKQCTGGRGTSHVVFRNPNPYTVCITVDANNGESRWENWILRPGGVMPKAVMGPASWRAGAYRMADSCNKKWRD